MVAQPVKKEVSQEDFWDSLTKQWQLCSENEELVMKKFRFSLFGRDNYEPKKVELKVDEV